MPRLIENYSNRKSYIWAEIHIKTSCLMQLYFNGDFIDDQVALPITQELSFLRGFAIFDFFGVRGGVPLFIDDYLDRFYSSAKLAGLEVPVDRAQLLVDIAKLISINGLKAAYCKVILSGGYSPDGFRLGKPNIYIMPQVLVEHPEERYTEGVKLITDEYKREMPQVKTTNYMHAIMLTPKMDASGAIEVLYHDNGLIRECSRCNFFIVKEGRLITPSTEILQGITRKQILRIAESDYDIEVRDVSINEIQHADEAFITSSTKMIFPVVEIDDTTIGQGRPGMITLHLLEKMKAWTTAYIQERT